MLKYEIQKERQTSFLFPPISLSAFNAIPNSLLKELAIKRVKKREGKSQKPEYNIAVVWTY